MSQTTRKTARKQPQRFASLRRECDVPDTLLVIRQVSPTGKETSDVYTISECGTDDHTARGFAIRKQDGTVYHVECSPSHRTCDCKGHLRHSHCKHSDAVNVLMGKGQLGGYPEPQRECDEDYIGDEQAHYLAAEYYSEFDECDAA